MSYDKSHFSERTIPQKALQKAFELHNQGRISEAYAVLARAGDEYAADAAEILGVEPSFFKSVVESLWDAQVGAKVRKEKWMPTARQHQKQYLMGMQKNAGHLPKSNFIENSYKKSAIDNNLPETVAIDLILNNFTRNQSVLDSMVDATKAQSQVFNADWRYGIQETAESIPNWDYIILNEDRRTPNWTETSLPSYDALSLTLNTGLRALASYPQNVINYKRANARYLTPKQRQLAKQGKLKQPPHSPVPVSQPQSFGQRYGLSPRLSTKDIVSMLQSKLDKPSLLSPPTAKTAATSLPASDIITAEDAHLIGFAERHGLGWRDVWEANKETVPNPNFVQAGTVLNLPDKPTANTAPSLRASEFVSAYADQKRREKNTLSLPTAGFFRDYVSLPAQTAKLGKSPTIDIPGINTDLLNKSANLEALHDYSVTLGDWSPVGGSSATVNAEAKASAASDQKELEAVEARTQQQRNQEAKVHQASVEAETKADRARTARAKAEEQKTLSALSAARTIDVAGVEKLGENAVSTAMAEAVDMPGNTQIVDTPTLGQDMHTTTPGTSPENHQGSDGANSRGSRASSRSRSQRSGVYSSRDAYRDHGKVGLERDKLGNLLENTGNVSGNKGKFDKTTGNYISGTNRMGTSTGGVGVDQFGREIGAYGQFTRDVVGKGDGSASAGNTRVICTELVRQGLMDASLQRLDIAFTLKHLSPSTVRGYHAWAVPYVRLMKHSALATAWIEPVARWRAEEIAHQLGERTKPNLKGKLVRWMMEPTCWVLGTMLGWVGDPDRFRPHIEPYK